MKQTLDNTLSSLGIKHNLACIIFLIFFLFPYVSSISHAATEDLHVAYLPKQEYLSSTYQPEDYLKDLFTIYSKYLNQNVDFIPAPFDAIELLDLFNLGKANVFAFYAKSPARMFQFKFSNNPITKANLLIVADKDTQIFFDDINAINGRSIAIYAGHTVEKNLLDEFMVKNNIVMEYQIFESYEQYLEANTDFHLTSSYYYVSNKKVVTQVGEVELYFATIPKYAQLLDILDNAITQANTNDAAALKELDDKYINKSIRWIYQNLNDEEIELITNQAEKYNIGYTSDHFPIMYEDSKGQPQGISKEVQDLFKQIYDFPNELNPYSPNTGLDLSKFDMLFSVVGDRKAKEEMFLASKTYFSLPMMLFERSDLNESDIKFFGMLDYSVLDHTIIQSNFPRWGMKIYSNTTELFEAYNSGDINAMLLSKTETEYAFSVFGASTNKIIPTSFVLPLKFYITKRFPAASLNILNAFISGLNPINIQKIIVATESNIRGPITTREFIEENKFILLGVISFVAIFVIAMHFLKMHLERRKFDKLSHTDALTGVCTKEKAFATMQRMLKRASPGEYMVLCIDIDNFTLLKQAYGSVKSDEVLRLLGTHLQDKYTAMHKSTCVSRIRDDIFLVFTKTMAFDEDFDSFDDGTDLTHEFKNILHSNYSLNMSCGCYIIDDTSLPIEDIIEYANVARGAGKGEPGMSTNFFSAEIRKAHNAQKDIIYKIEHGVENEEFILNFQPKINLQTDQICGAEVLVRWQQPDGSVIYPKDFISVLEANAFISQLDLHVFEKTCQFIQKHKQNFNIPPLAINISGITLLQDDMHAQIDMIMQQYDITPNEIEIEITESSMVAETQTFVESVKELQQSGFVMAIDDFGTGFSSISKLSTMYPQIIKLDRIFLNDKFTTKKGIFLVASVITMLRRLGIQVVAEGVETDKDVLILKKLHCDVAQGYHFFKPLPENSFLKVIGKRP